MKEKRAHFSGKLGYVLAVAGSAVGLGNIWRFPYLAAKHGGGMFLLVYLILVVTVGSTLIITESALGRMSNRSPVGAFGMFGKGKFFKFGGWFNAIIPLLIVPYYSVVGGWVLKYLYEYIVGGQNIATDSFFSDFTGNAVSNSGWFLVFAALVIVIVAMGVQGGIERVSKWAMPALVVLAVIIAGYSITRPGALEGVKYFLVPNFEHFSIMTVVAAMGQMFYSLSIAMGILITYGSYIKKDVDLEKSTRQVELFDTGIAVLAGLMVIPAVFAFSGGKEGALNSGPTLMFVTLPKVFESMGLSRVIGAAFFLLVLFAALTSAISLAETCISTFCDEFSWSRKKSCGVFAGIFLVLGLLSALGFNVLSAVQPLGMDNIWVFFDFLTNTLMMPIAALLVCYLVVRYVKVQKIVDEVSQSSSFKSKKMYKFCITYLCPVCIAIILISSLLSLFGIISI